MCDQQLKISRQKLYNVVLFNTTLYNIFENVFRYKKLKEFYKMVDKQKKKPVIISTDPGIDDAVAIAIATSNETLDVKLIVPISGNVSLAKTTLNTQKLLTFFNKPIRVVPGSNKPLLRPAKDASGVHGKTGMDGYPFPEIKIPVDNKTLAATAMHQVISESTEPVTLVGIGPLTDIALFIHQYPDDLKKVGEIVLMGGSLGRGNFGVLSEFNFGTDPEAAKIVFTSGAQIRVAPMEVGRQAKIMPETSNKIKTLGSVGDMFYKLFSKYRGGSFNKGLNMYDALAIALVIKPELFEQVETHVEIETTGRYTAGASLMDLKGYLGMPNNARVATNVDTKQFEDWFVKEIAKTM
ncbi:putative cytidine/uridine-specific hydrolase [Lentilactobacillus kisonensis F0435]|uniref:Putative cytidine/uridine-specific hydrolase n=2 Tax=Lentilactobacillus kisonensis TaxID=481722 RepID=H1LHQ2_9LACO|nr:putative cytidine/uridine-specific hydrolase [Lentilactobacillus kisonensis F0435]